jgi:hypothetical protein
LLRLNIVFCVCVSNALLMKNDRYDMLYTHTHSLGLGREEIYASVVFFYAIFFIGEKKENTSLLIIIFEGKLGNIFFPGGLGLFTRLN